jgi:anti-sigma B factor antagonist
MERLKIDTEWEGQVPLVSVAGEVDMANAGDLVRAVEEAARDAPQGVVLVLSGVEFMDSSGLGALAGLHQALDQQQRKLVLATPSVAVHRILDLTGTLGRFLIAPDTAAAAEMVTGE